MRVEPPWVGFVSFYKRPESPLTLLSGKDTARRLLSLSGSRPLPDTKSAGTLILDLPASRTVRNKCYLFLSRSVYAVLLYQPKLRHHFILAFVRNKTQMNSISINQMTLHHHLTDHNSILCATFCFLGFCGCFTEALGSTQTLWLSLSQSPFWLFFSKILLLIANLSMRNIWYRYKIKSQNILFCMEKFISSDCIDPELTSLYSDYYPVVPAPLIESLFVPPLLPWWPPWARIWGSHHCTFSTGVLIYPILTFSLDRKWHEN